MYAPNQFGQAKRQLKLVRTGMKAIYLGLGGQAIGDLGFALEAGNRMAHAVWAQLGEYACQRQFHPPRRQSGYDVQDMKIFPGFFHFIIFTVEGYSSIYFEKDLLVSLVLPCLPTDY